MGFAIFSTFFLSLIWTCRANNDTDYEDSGSSLHHQIISTNCSFDSIFEKENPCSSDNVYSICLVPNTDKIRKCFFLPFETAFNSSTTFVFIAALASLAASSVIPIEHHVPQPYKFGYDIKDKHGEQYRQEEGNGGHAVKGSYGFTDARGVKRQVDYVADHAGFRAQVKTNEPGTANQNPAAVQVISDAPYAGGVALGGAGIGGYGLGLGGAALGGSGLGLGGAALGGSGLGLRGAAFGGAGFGLRGAALGGAGLGLGGAALGGSGLGLGGAALGGSGLALRGAALGGAGLGLEGAALGGYGLGRAGLGYGVVAPGNAIGAGLGGLGYGGYGLAGLGYARYGY